MPTSSDWTATPAIGPDGTVVILGRRDGPVRGLVPSTIARALVGTLESGWQDVDMGGVDYHSPPGFPNSRGGGAVPLAVTHGANGYVAVGRALFADRSYFTFTSVAVIWRSADGLDWQLIDPRDLLGPSKLSTLETVVAVPGGYVAAGQLADSPSKPSALVLLGSTDGVTWKRISLIDGPYSLDPNQLLVRGNELLLQGVEYACVTNSGHISNFGWAPQLRVWRSTDGGATWNQVDLLASELVTETEPLPENPADCPPAGSALNDRFRSGGGFLGIADGQAFVVATDGERLASSADFATWAQYTLPGAATEDSRGIASQMVVRNPYGLFFVSLEKWRNPDNDRPMDGGLQTIVWRLPVGGGEAERLPSGRPLLNGGNLLAGPNDDVWLWEGASIRRSTAGPLQAWGECNPAPLADCSFVITEITAPGADLHGIDLRAARVRGGDLSGANLAGAFLGEATIYATLENADLSDARATNANIYASLTGANLSGADLTRARVDATFFDATRDSDTVAEGVVVWIEDGQTLEGRDFSGTNLHGFSFYGAFGLPEPGSLRAADFSGADLRNASFSRVDLTGADFGGAKLEFVYFGTDVTCPDGQPTDSAKLGAAACRI